MSIKNTQSGVTFHFEKRETLGDLQIEIYILSNPCFQMQISNALLNLGAVLV